jgi:hypothetical protein
MLARIILLFAMAGFSLGAVAAEGPGLVIDHLPAATGRYVGSPSIAILPDGRYVTSHDVFGPNSGMNKAGITRIFRSEDRGRSWRPLAGIEGQFWSTLFVHREALYLIGTNRENGDAVIRRSVDGGATWTEPRDEDTGLLLRGRYHCAPQPVVVHGGRIWRAMEDTMGEGKWARWFRAFMISAPVAADLLKARSWTQTNRLAGDPSWLGGRFAGWLEGNAVVDPSGTVLDILRVDYPPGGKAAVIRVSPDGKTAEFDPHTGFIDLPGAATKFTIRFDRKSHRYWSLVNAVAPEDAEQHAARVRNTVALVSSKDLAKWMVHGILLHHPDTKRHAWQYLDWQFAGNDMAAVARTAFDDDAGGAHSYHDANFMTFHRIRNFRHFPQSTDYTD